MRGNKFLNFLIISLTLTAFLAGYVMVNRGLSSSPQSKTGTILDKFASPTPSPKPDETENLKVFSVSSVKAVSVANSIDRTGVIYFEKNTGKIFEFNFEDSREKIVSDSVLPNFISSAWSPVKKEVLSSFYSANGTKIKYHNYNNAKTIDLNNNAHTASFSPDGSLITYFIAGNASISASGPLEGEAGKIYISQPDGTYPKKIFDTRISNLAISWPIKDRISIETPDHTVFLITENGKLTKLLEPKTNLNTKWSIGGEKLIFSWDENTNSQNLWLKDVESKSEKDLSIPTSASRCVWSIDNINIFCAIAKTPSVDEIYQINTLDRSKKLIAEPEIKIKFIFLSALENYLIITNAADEKLYGVRISD